MTTKLGPWPIGIDNLAQDTALPAGALRDACNVLIDDDGSVDSAQALQLVLAAPGLHSLWGAPDGRLYGVQDGELVEFSGGALQPLGQLPSNGRACFAWLNEQLLVACGGALLRLAAAGLEPLTLPAPALVVRPAPAGGLAAGRYGVAISLRRGDEEGGLSTMAMVEVGEGGGIALDLPAHDGATSVSVYCTEANGGLLLRALDAPLGMSGFLVGAAKLGAQPGTRFLEPLPGGQCLATWMGRLLVADGRTLRYSAPLRYGLHHPGEDFLQLPSRIRMVLPVADGVYLADARRCYFLGGTDPEQWVLRELAAVPPPEGCAALVDGSLFELDGVPAMPVAVWLSEKGFVLGLPGGQLVLPQEKRLRLPMPGRGWLVAVGHRLYAGN